ncbi:MAG TPA: hypothetical protein VIQ62_10590, partial [Burkholderiales bacterium]
MAQMCSAQGLEVRRVPRIAQRRHAQVAHVKARRVIQAACGKPALCGDVRFGKERPARQRLAGHGR